MYYSCNIEIIIVFSFNFSRQPNVYFSESELRSVMAVTKSKNKTPRTKKSARTRRFLVTSPLTKTRKGRDELSLYLGLKVAKINLTRLPEAEGASTQTPVGVAQERPRRSCGFGAALLVCFLAIVMFIIFVDEASTHRYFLLE